MLTPALFGLNSDEGISLVPNDLMFCACGGKAETYWLVPLVGPFKEHRSRREGPPHPMALDGASYTPFAVDGRACGLQVFDSKLMPKHPLASYDAVLFGELLGSATTQEAIWNALPRGWDSALSFGIGADVTAPWIETRGDYGRLVRRFYSSVGRRLAKDGFSAFSGVNELIPDSGLGAFLEAFFSVPLEKREALEVPMKLIRLGTPGSFHIEDSITDLVKALDRICKVHGLVTQELRSRMDTDNRDRVATILEETKERLLRIRSENLAEARQSQVSLLDVIVSNVANVTNRSRDFGIAVGDLLRILNLHDAEVMDRHYQTLGEQGCSWEGLMSKVRGAVIHDGFLRMHCSRDLHSWFQFARHLHDLCKRVILREVGYKGVYQASTNPWQNNYAVDRVTPEVSAGELGFSVVPTLHMIG
jgi:hypothetical protein